MPRPLRIEFPGAWYHVMNRGAGGQLIYNNSYHREQFLELLSDASEQYNIEIHTYCLMDNHYHLLVHTPQANLSGAMRHINGVYTQRYNRLTQTDGPLFRGRYKAILIQDDIYLSQVSRYIHLNPVDAGLIKAPGDYRWSSMQYYVGKSKKPNWLHTNFILKMLSKQNREKVYNTFVSSGVDNETKKFYSQRKLPSIAGDKNYNKKMLSTVKEEIKIAASSDYNYTKINPSKEEVLGIILEYFTIGKSQLKLIHRGKTNKAKTLAIYASRKFCGLKIKDIAAEFSLKSHSSINKIMIKAERLIKEDQEFSVAYQHLMARMKCQINT